LVDNGSGPWVLRALATLDALAPRLVVTGAAADQVEALLPAGVPAVRNPDPATGMGDSLRLGLQALAADGDVDAVLVMLVDLPDVGAAVVDRVAAVADRSILARAAYGGVPGHPVLLGADHLPGVIAAAHGDAGARDYLRGRPVTLVECGDLATGVDRDTP
jgi:CTP:molybdopterin cytidylyltransferase MocA